MSSTTSHTSTIPIEHEDGLMSPEEGLEKAIKEGLEDVFEGLFAKEETNETYKSISLAKLDEMKTRLASGYTSYWS